MTREQRLEKALRQCARIIAAALSPDASPPRREAVARVVSVNARSVETLNAKIARGESVIATDGETGIELRLAAVPHNSEVRLLGVKRSNGESFIRAVARWDSSLKRAF
jgi:tRNA pseudouridine-54 N-methylase